MPLLWDIPKTALKEMPRDILRELFVGANIFAPFDFIRQDMDALSIDLESISPDDELSSYRTKFLYLSHYRVEMWFYTLPICGRERILGITAACQRKSPLFSWFCTPHSKLVTDIDEIFKPIYIDRAEQYQIGHDDLESFPHLNIECMVRHSQNLVALDGRGEPDYSSSSVDSLWIHWDRKHLAGNLPDSLIKHIKDLDEKHYGEMKGPHHSLIGQKKKS